MAHIVLRPAEESGALELFINGIDFTNETYRQGLKLVEVGEPDYAEVGFQVTFAVSRLDLGCDADLQVTDRFKTVAQRVRSITEVDY